MFIICTLVFDNLFLVFFQNFFLFTTVELYYCKQNLVQCEGSPRIVESLDKVEKIGENKGRKIKETLFK